jgi:flagellin-like hook-associated protein FlgL
MALSNVYLTAGMRSNLLSLQRNAELFDQTQLRLSTGKKVNSALEDPVNFFKAQAHSNRASDLASRKDGMSEAIQLIKAADSGISGITNLLETAKSLAQAARTAEDPSTLEDQYDVILDQIADLAEDSGYGGKNLLDSDELTVQFNEDGTNSLSISGFSATTSGTIGSVSITAADFSDQDAIDTAIGEIDDAIAELRTQSQQLSSNLSIITFRQDFTQNMIDTLQKGADNLVLADMNEEGANMLMLQTRQQLGTTALSLASQAAQSVLRLF